MNNWRVWLACVWLVISAGATVDSLEAKQAHLVTYGAGTEVWEWFGHNAIWLTDPDTGLDHTFSFGYFDFNEAGFYSRFVRGEMLYYGAAVSAQREFQFYRAADRSIRVQTLNLSEEEFDLLATLLSEAIEPYPQYYPYDYFWANCSTWLRDLLDVATQGALKRQFYSAQATESFRSHTRNQTMGQPLAQLGLMALLGPSADRPIRAWDEAFLPSVLADQLTQIERAEGPLVLEDRWLYDSEQVSPRPSLWLGGPWQLGVWGVLIGSLILWAFFSHRGLSVVLQTAAVIGLSVLGTMLLALWAFTEHEATYANPLLWALHPLWLGLLWFWPSLVSQITWWICGGAVGIGVGVWLVSSVHPDVAVICLVLPVILTLLWVTRPWIKPVKAMS